MRFLGRVLLVCAIALTGRWAAAADTNKGVEDLRKEIDDLRRQLTAPATPQTTIESVDAMADTHCLCKENQPVTTRVGKLEVSGLLQVWEQYISQDRKDVFGTFGNQLVDNSGYSIRRAELKFTMDIHENIAAVVMIDPAREALSFANVPSNQGLFKSGPVQMSNYNGTFVPPPGTFPGADSTTIADLVRNGGGLGNRVLQDAYINIHGILPHHDVTIGQFKPPAGEEGVRSSANLDFCERAMVTYLNDFRDLGVQVHGTWWEDCDTKIGRLQYWAGVFDGAGNYFDTAGDFQNRSDDNDSKDLAGKLMVRPIWTDCLLGRLELGVWGEYGRHGESGDHSTDGSNPVPGLDRLRTNAYRWGAWAMYKPMGCLRGLWMRGEYGAVRDRTAPFTVNAFGLGSGPDGEQASPNPFRREGWYASTGYKLTDSIFADHVNKNNFFAKLVQPVEFAFRYEQFGNIIVEDVALPDQNTEVYKTRVFTAGVNYYVNAYKHRIQLNYLNVHEDVNTFRYPGIRSPKNDQIVLSYQIAF
ncbi:MAG TPA: porin [Planctomycetota bacterium]|nr:porin [Planctomycetota bacterium]